MDRTRNKDGSLRAIRDDALLINKAPDLVGKFGLRRDIHVGTILDRFGARSLSDVRRRISEKNTKFAFDEGLI